MRTLEVNLSTVKSIIEAELNLVNVPLNESFKNLSISDQQLTNLVGPLSKTFGKSLRPQLSETIYSFTERLMNVKSFPTPESVLAAAKQDPLI